MRFIIDGQGFDPTRVDQAVRAGAVEEWTFANTSPMNHPMHLHVWPMQVLARAGGQRTASPGRTSSTSRPAAE